MDPRLGPDGRRDKATAAAEEPDLASPHGCKDGRGTKPPSVEIPSSNQTWLENGPFIDDYLIKTSIHMGFSIAMFDYQRVFSM